MSQTERGAAMQTDSFGALMPALSYKTAVEPIREVLRYLKDTYELDAFAAGGALRDLWHGVDVKDVDVFASGVSRVRASAICDALESEHPHAGAAFREVNTDYGDWSHDIHTLYDFQLPDAPAPVQLIFSYTKLTPRDVVAGFDMGFCKIAATADEDIITPDFLLDVGRQTATHVNPNINPDRVATRFQRLHNKYPQFRFVADGFDARGFRIKKDIEYAL